MNQLKGMYCVYFSFFKKWYPRFQSHMVKVGSSRSSPSSSEGREVVFFVFQIAVSTDDTRIHTQHFSLCHGFQTSALFRGLGGLETGRGAETQWPGSWSPGWVKQGSFFMSHRLGSSFGAPLALGLLPLEDIPCFLQSSVPSLHPQEFLKTRSFTELL